MTCEDLVEWAREHIGGYKYPREVVLVDVVPLTAVGKIDRKLLRIRAHEVTRDAAAGAHPLARPSGPRGRRAH